MNLIDDLKHDNDCRMRDALDRSLARPAECGCGAVYSHLAIPQRLYDSEINFSISCFWDGGWKVSLGDEMNGWDAQAETRSYVDALEWLDKETRRRYPDSAYVTGKWPEGWRPDGDISSRG